MKHWRIHLGWAVVTLVVAGAWGRIVASRPAAEPAPPAAPQAEMAHPALSGRSPVPKPVAYPAAPQPATTTPPSEEQAIRKLLERPETWVQGLHRLLALPDVALKTALLTEMAWKGETSARYQAIRELVRLRGRDVAPLLMNVLRPDDEDARLRTLAAKHLGTTGAVESTDLLLRAFRSEQEGLSLAAANALQKFGLPGPAREALEGCLKRCESADAAVRRKAVEDASEIEHESALPLLVRGLRDSSGDVRMAAIYALAYGSQPSALVLVEPLVQDPNPEVAEVAREAVETLKHNPR